MNRRSPSMLFVAMSLVGFSAVAQAQTTVNLPAVDFNDPLIFSPISGTPNPVNATYTATATNSFLLSSSVNQLTGGTLARINGLVTATTTCGFRMSNSGYPGVWADFSLFNGSWSAPGTATDNNGTAALTASTRSASGPLVGASIASGSSFAFEAYCSQTTGAFPNDTEVEGTNIGFTLNVAAFTSTVQSTFAYPGTFSGVGTGSLTSSSQFTATATGSQYILTAATLTNSLTINNFDAAGQIGDLRVSGQNSAYPGASLVLSPWPGTSGHLMGAPVTHSFVGIGGNVSGTLAGAIINPGSTWTWIVYDNSDAGTDGMPDFGVSNLSFSLTGTGFTATYDSGVLAGPLAAAGNVGNVGNAVVTLAPVASTFVMGSTLIFEGTATRVLSNSSASELRVRLRNSAYPTFFTTEFQPAATEFVGSTLSVSAFQLTSPSVREVYTNRVANTLRGLSIPAGSTFSAEFWDTVDNGAGADANWTNVRIRTQSGTAWGPTGVPTPVLFTDLGSISNANATTANALSGISPAIASGNVRWFKVTLPTAVDGSLGQYINFYVSSAASSGAVSDSTISLFDNDGRHLGFDDDSGQGLFSMLTMGAPGATTPYAVSPVSGEEAFSGKDAGGLPAGTYWIAVSPYHVLGTYADGFNVVTASTAAFPNGVKLNVISNLPPAPISGTQQISGTLNLTDTGLFGSGLDRYIDYTVRQNGAVVGGGMVTASGSSTPFTMSLPSDVTGAVEIIFDGSSFLRNSTSLSLDGAYQTIGAVNMQNGDVDRSGEVDAADIDEVIASFGEQWPGGFGNIDADVDVSGEVDAADIDIVIANFGGQDN